MNLDGLPKYGFGCFCTGIGVSAIFNNTLVIHNILETLRIIHFIPTMPNLYTARLVGFLCGVFFLSTGILIIRFRNEIDYSISKSLEEALQNKIGDLESQIAEKFTELEELKLQRSLDNSGSTSGNGALSIVINMRTDGKTEAEIAHFLKNNGLSYSQVGVLLHDNPLNVTDNAISQHAKRLLGVV